MLPRARSYLALAPPTLVDDTRSRHPGYQGKTRPQDRLTLGPQSDLIGAPEPMIIEVVLPAPNGGDACLSGRRLSGSAWPLARPGGVPEGSCFLPGGTGEVGSNDVRGVPAQ